MLFDPRLGELYKILIEKNEEKRQHGFPSVDGRIILKLILNK